MDKGKIEAMVTKFLEKFAISMLKKHRKFCRRGLTHFDATPIFKKIVQIHMGHPVCPSPPPDLKNIPTVMCHFSLVTPGYGR